MNADPSRSDTLNPRHGEIDENGRLILSPVYVGREMLAILQTHPAAHDAEVTIVIPEDFTQAQD